MRSSNPNCSRAFVRGSIGTCAALCGITASIISVSVVASARQADSDTYAVVPTYKVGDVDRYEMSTKLMMQFGPVTVEQTITSRVKETVTEVSPSGAHTVLDEFESVTGVAGGKQSDLTGMFPKTTAKYDEKGKLTVQTENNDRAVTGWIAVIVKDAITARQSVVPPHAMKIGESWDAESDLGMIPKQPITMKTHSKLEKIARVGDVREATLNQSAELKLGQDDIAYTAHTEGTSTVNAANGKLLRSASHTKGEATAHGQTIDMTIETTLKRLTAADTGGGNTKQL